MPDVDVVLARAKESLLRHFGYSDLRPFQRDAIAAWAAGKDVLVTLATGAGKSLCFQLPALCDPLGRFVLVISPLVALMQDQVRTLQQRQIRAALCGSGARGDISASSWSALENGDFQIVYMCPEFALNNLQQIATLQSKVCLLAVDEVHCVSSWGHDFRPRYRELGRLRDIFAQVPILGATATCTQEVRSDIMQSLLFRKDAILVNAPMNRSNLRYIVQQRSSFAADLGPLFAAEDNQAKVSARRAMMIDNATIGPTSSAIVYVGTKAYCEEVTAWLVAHGVAAMAYHAGLRMETRSSVHRDFIVDNIQVVVATVAFGMGIDKPSIRRIIHYGPVQTLEHYVQQCGRAGRDGEIAECIAFVKPDQDSTKARALIMQDLADHPDKQNRAQRMLSLNAELTMFLKDSSCCRRLRLLRYFGESPREWTNAEEPPPGECVLLPSGGRATCRLCDVCLTVDRHGDPKEKDDSEDFSLECRILLQCVDACGGKMGSGVACAMAAGHETNQTRSRGLGKNACFGKGSARSLQWWKDFFPHVRQEGFLQEQVAVLSSGIRYAAISVSGAGRAFLDDMNKHFHLGPVPKELRSKSSRVAVAVSQVGSAPRFIRASALTPTENLYQRLVHVRLAWQRREGLSGESFVSNAALKSFIKVRPSSIDVARQHIHEMPAALNMGLLSALVEECRQFCGQYSMGMDEVTEASSEQVEQSPEIEKNYWSPSNTQRRPLNFSHDTSKNCATASSSLNLCDFQAASHSERSIGAELFHAEHSSSWLCRSSKKPGVISTLAVDPCPSLDRYEFKPASVSPGPVAPEESLGEHSENVMDDVAGTCSHGRIVDHTLSELREKESMLEKQLAAVREQIREVELAHRKRSLETLETPEKTQNSCDEIRMGSEPNNGLCEALGVSESSCRATGSSTKRKLPWTSETRCSSNARNDTIPYGSARERSRSRSLITLVEPSAWIADSGSTSKSASTDRVCVDAGGRSDEPRVAAAIVKDEGASSCQQSCHGVSDNSWTDEWLDVLDL